MTGHGRHARRGAGRQHQLVVRQFFFLAGGQILDKQSLAGPVNGQSARAGTHGEALHLAEKFGIAHRVIRRGAQVVDIVDLAGYEVRNAAAAVRNEFVFIHKRDLGVRHEPLAAAGSLGTKRDTTDNQNLFRHTIAP